MQSYGKILSFVFVFLLLCTFFIIIFFPKDLKPEKTALRIGCGDDITKIFLDEILSLDSEKNLISSYLFADCCADAAQWALKTSEIDLGFYCSQAAQAMVKALPDFEIYCPAVMNCEVLAVNKGFSLSKLSDIGIPRKREFLQSIFQKTYPDVENFQQINPSYLMFALRGGDVDGVILDISNLSKLSYETDFYPISSNDYISYCLVVRKSIENAESFSAFLSLYDKAAEKLNDKAYQKDLLGLDTEFLEKINLKFLSAK